MTEEPKLDYDEALFLQALRSRADEDGTVTLDDIAEAFWSTAWDLELALVQQRPEKVEEAKSRFRSEMAPMFVGFLKPFGLRLRE